MEPVECTTVNILDLVLECALDFSDIVDQRINMYDQISSGYSDQQSQTVLGAVTVVHEERYPGEGSVLPGPAVNFLESGHSPEQSDVNSYYSEESCTTPHHFAELCHLTSPVGDASNRNFQWGSCSNLRREHFSFTPSDASSYELKREEFGLTSYHQPVHHEVSDQTAFPLINSPSISISSPSSTIYSVSSPGTPAPSSCARGRRLHDTTPYAAKSRRRLVEKGTEEYVEKRARNNVAVRKSRAKAKEKQRETEGRVRCLLGQNEQLQKKVDLLTKELAVLKGLFINIGASIPDEFLKLVGDS